MSGKVAEENFWTEEGYKNTSRIVLLFNRPHYKSIIKKPVLLFYYIYLLHVSIQLSHHQANFMKYNATCQRIDRQRLGIRPRYPQATTRRKFIARC
jgi:hypothetical protein